MITTEHHAVTGHPETNPALIYTGVINYMTPVINDINTSKKLKESNKVYILLNAKSDQLYLSIVEDDTFIVPLYKNTDLKNIYPLIDKKS